VDHVVNVMNWYAWKMYSTDNGTAEIIGSQDPPQQGPCAPCYKVGSFRDWATSYSFGESYVRDSVAITGTNDSSGTNNLYNSGWWYRSAGSSFWPGPTQ
jgi:hypothetical protein